MTVKWETNDTFNQGTYKIKVIGSIFNLITGQNYIGSLEFYLFVVSEIKDNVFNCPALENVTNNTVFLSNCTIALINGKR